MNQMVTAIPKQKHSGTAGQKSPGTASRLSFTDWLDRNDRWVLPMPAMLLVIALLVFPAGYTLYLSVTTWFLSSNTAPKFVGLENYINMWSDTRFTNSLWHTLYFVLLSVGLQVILGLVTALIFHRPFKGRGIARAFFLLPMMATPAAVALVWMMALSSGVGFIPWLVEAVGLPAIPFLSDANWVLVTLALVDTWQWTPLVMLIILSGLAALPAEPYEAAGIDGASAFQKFRFITLPLLRPALIVAVMFRTIDCLKTFETILIITGGGPAWSSEIVNLYAYNSLFQGFHFGYGSALLTVLGLMVFLVAYVFSRVRRGAMV